MAMCIILLLGLTLGYYATYNKLLSGYSLFEVSEIVRAIIKQKVILLSKKSCLMKVFISIIIFFIVGATVSAQPIKRSVVDSLFKVLTKEKQGIERIKALNGLAQFYIFKQ